MTCKHCGEGICDPCWQKRADILFERDDLRGMTLEKMRRGEPASTLAELADACEAALAQEKDPRR